MKPLGIIINPAANRGRAKVVGEKVFEHFAKAGVAVINLSASSSAEAETKANQLIQSQEISAVIAVGGDGTSQLGAGIAIPNQIPLGLIPAGSGNDQFRQLNIDLKDIETACDNIISSLGNPRRVDAMKVSLDNRELWSLGSISAGFDALCATRANDLKWPKGPNSYIAAMLLELPRFESIEYHLDIDGEKRVVDAMLCGVANVKNFGGGMMISPDSDITDGELEVFILHKVTRAKLLRIFPTVYKGNHVKFSEIEIFKARSIRISNDQFPVTCDGELVGNAPFAVEVHPGACQLLSQ
ncbi:MAG: diacylglycerol kinase family lipid kinase [Aquiluna sp.]|nr:diacylglycerol kinase family lipid kinase [Aquiluna sp.]